MWMWALGKIVDQKVMNIEYLKKDSLSYKEGFFSFVFMMDDYAIKILKKKYTDEKAILDYYMDKGNQFSPSLYKEIININTPFSKRRGLKMERIFGSTLQNWVKKNRNNNLRKKYLKIFNNIFSNILNHLDNAYNRMKFITASNIRDYRFMQNYYNQIKDLIFKSEFKFKKHI
ncbi:MAG: hypothetical protein GF329_01675, partial [Candidatus Lokiarchaeota archaeon]|nr:hypothetical protein [Candidatus Lokiarchaeota archaeon]